MKKAGQFLAVIGLSIFCTESALAAYDVPGCKEAFTSIDQASLIKPLKDLIALDCAIMYKEGWRLPATGGVANQTVCAPAWNVLGQSNKLGDAKFIVTHNCPALYNLGWVKPQP
ncbi:hypothetical protein [Anabaena sp. CCY 9402-a]|uniref:hypothetical protein n=1 Tax=Anabaena sp. CCY 9402-a TaxID=3103867 RepID=UPI0039C72CD5